MANKKDIMKKIKSALISVSDKSNLKTLLQTLNRYKVKLISSGGTFKAIKKLFYDFILCDRYLLDTLIDFEINFSQNDFKKNLVWIFLIKLLPIPDLSLMLDVPFLESQKRLENKKEPYPDSFELAKYRYSLYKKYSVVFNYVMKKK